MQACPALSSGRKNLRRRHWNVVGLIQCGGELLIRRHDRRERCRAVSSAAGALRPCTTGSRINCLPAPGSAHTAIRSRVDVRVPVAAESGSGSGFAAVSRDEGPRLFWELAVLPVRQAGHHIVPSNGQIQEKTRHCEQHLVHVALYVRRALRAKTVVRTGSCPRRGQPPTYCAGRSRRR
jgi:hypothetical protein